MIKDIGKKNLVDVQTLMIQNMSFAVFVKNISSMIAEILLKQKHGRRKFRMTTRLPIGHARVFTQISQV